MKLLRTHHVAVICSNYANSRHFYTKILGLEVISEVYRQERNSYKLDLRLPDGVQIELFSFTDPPRRPSYPEACGLRHLAFEVEDVGQAVADLQAHGVNVEEVRVDPHTGKRLHVLCRSRRAAPGIVRAVTLASTKHRPLSKIGLVGAAADYAHKIQCVPMFLTLASSALTLSWRSHRRAARPSQ